MGGHQSKNTRTVNFDNESSEGLIDISDDVVNRLKGQKAVLEKKGTVEKGSKEEEKKPKEVVIHNVPSSSPAVIHGARRTPGFLHYAEPSLTSMQVRKEKENELRANDEYWKQLLVKREEEYKQNNQAMEKEYNDTVESVKKMFENAPATYQPAPCQEFRARLIACYRAYPNETLMCAQEVKDFTACVDKNRVQLLSKYASDVNKK